MHYKAFFSKQRASCSYVVKVLQKWFIGVESFLLFRVARARLRKLHFQAFVFVGPLLGGFFIYFFFLEDKIAAELNYTFIEQLVQFYTGKKNNYFQPFCYTTSLMFKSVGLLWTTHWIPSGKFIAWLFSNLNIMNILLINDKFIK